MIARDEAVDLLLLHFHVLLLLLHGHDEAAVGRQLVLALGLLQATLTVTRLLLPLNLGVRARRL